MGHPRWLRDIFKACDPTSSEDALRRLLSPRRLPTPRAHLFVAIRVRRVRLHSLARLGQPAANRQFLIPFPTAIG